MDRSRFTLTRLGLGLPIAFLGLFFCYPLTSILTVSLAPDGAIDLNGFGALASSAYLREVFAFTVGQAALSTAITLALVMPGAFVVARYTFPGKSLLLSLATLPFVLPTVVAAAAFAALLGDRGVVNLALMRAFSLERPPVQLEETLPLVLLAHVFYNYPIALRIIGGYWANQNPRLEEAARALGASPWRVWWEVRLPLLRPAMLAAGALIFIFTFTSFGVIVLLGGPHLATLEVEIYRQATALFNLPTAAALSIVQIAVLFALMLVYTRIQARPSTDPLAARRTARTPRTWRARLFVALNVMGIAMLLFAPLIALIARSFADDDGFTTRYYAALFQNPRGSILFVPPIEAVARSVSFALATTAIAVPLGVLAAYLIERRGARWLDALFILPLAASAVTLGFGYLVAFDEPPLAWRSSAWLTPVAHTLVAMPLVVRSILPALRAVPPNARAAAAVLGASPARVFRMIDLPLIARGLAVGTAFAFTISMGEFGASLFVVRPDTPTMPIAIARLLGQPGAINYGQAMAMSSLLLLVCAAAFLVIERARTLGIGEF